MRKDKIGDLDSPRRSLGIGVDREIEKGPFPPLEAVGRRFRVATPELSAVTLLGIRASASARWNLAWGNQSLGTGGESPLISGGPTDGERCKFRSGHPQAYCDQVLASRSSAWHQALAGRPVCNALPIVYAYE